MTEQTEVAKIRALALLAGIKPNEVHELPNGYWPDCAGYTEIRAENPWLLFVCDGGTFTIGWRKRVLSVAWTHGDADPITEDDLKWITHDPRMFHAYGWSQALLFLARVVEQLNKAHEVKHRKE